MQCLYQSNIKELFYAFSFSRAAFEMTQKAIFSKNPLKTLKDSSPTMQNYLPALLQNQKKIKFLMSLKRPVSDTISQIPDFGAARQGFC